MDVTFIRARTEIKTTYNTNAEGYDWMDDLRRDVRTTMCNNNCYDFIVVKGEYLFSHQSYDATLGHPVRWDAECPVSQIAISKRTPEDWATYKQFVDRKVDEMVARIIEMEVD